jgi:hypothetical protein
MPIALPLVCCFVASGAKLRYLITDALGPALLTLPKWKVMLDVCAQDPAESGSWEPGEVLGAALAPWEREREVKNEATEMEGVLPRSEEKEKEGRGGLAPRDNARAPTSAQIKFHTTQFFRINKRT